MVDHAKARKRAIARFKELVVQSLVEKRRSDCIVGATDLEMTKVSMISEGIYGYEVSRQACTAKVKV